MKVRVIEPPEAVVMLADAKRHLRVDVGDTEDDAYIEGLVAAATSWIDGPDGWLGRSLGKQTLEVTAADFSRCGLPYPPVIDIVSVIYTAPDGVTNTLDPSLYRVVGRDLLPSGSWPSVSCQPDAVRITYRAGYGKFDNADPPSWTPALPKPIWAAILMLVGLWYQNREPAMLGQPVQELPFTVNALLSPFRVYPL